MDERIVAVGLLTEHDLRLLGSNFDRVWPVDESTCFSELLEAIDEAERATRTTITKVAELPDQQKPD